MTPDPWCVADRHGSRSDYFVGCRCTPARAAEAAYRRRWRSYRGQRLIDPTGTKRRLRALYRMGWNGAEIGARLGVSHGQVSVLHVRHEKVLVTTALKIAAVYDELAMRSGPSELTRRYAIRQGWAPPLAWDDDTIDDPDARPAGLAKSTTSTRAALDTEDVEMLASTGATWDVAAFRLGVSRNSIEQHLWRKGRLDVAHRLSRNSEGEFRLAARRNQWSA